MEARSALGHWNWNWKRAPLPLLLLSALLWRSHLGESLQGWRVVIVPRRRSSPAHTPQCLSKRDALPEAGCSKRRPAQGTEEEKGWERDRPVSEDSLGWKRSRRGCVAPQAPAPSAAPARTPKRDCALVVAGVFLVRASRDSRCPRGGFQSAR